MRKLAELAAMVAAAGATADRLYHLNGDMCALRVVKDGIGPCHGSRQPGP